METYLSIGKKNLSYENFNPINKNLTFKPNGGLWATLHNTKYKTYNAWLDFISSNLHILFYKYIKSNDYNIPAVLFTLKDNAKILHINDENDLNNLMNKYFINNYIDYKTLSKDFDGIYLCINNLLRTINDNNLKKELADFDVDSLILFNLDCIAYYQEAIVTIATYDYEINHECIEYEIKIKEEQKQIEDISSLTRKRPE